MCALRSLTSWKKLLGLWNEAGELCKCKKSIKSRIGLVIANGNRLKFAEALRLDSIGGPIRE